MGIMNNIITKRRTFVKIWGMQPEIIVITTKSLDDILGIGINKITGCETLFGMEVEIGDEVRCKFKDRIKTADSYKSRGLEA